MTSLLTGAAARPSRSGAPAVADILELGRFLRRTVPAAPGGDLLLRRAIPIVESMIFAADDPRLDHLLGGAAATDLRADLNALYCGWETRLEHDFVAAVAAGRATTIRRYPLYERFQRLIAREVAMLAARPGRLDRVLFIGSGPVPISAIWLHLLTGARVDCVDLAEDAVATSRRLLRLLALDGAVRVAHAAGHTVDPAGYDAVFIALLAKPKRAILDNLLRAGRPGTRIVCRTSLGLRTLLYEPTDLAADVPAGLAIADTRPVRGPADDTISSLLLLPAPAGAQRAAAAASC